MSYSRRSFLKAGLAVAGATTLGAVFPVFSADFWQQPRELWLYRAATGDSRKIVYWKDGELDPLGYQWACYLLRDVHQNKSVLIDTVLLDVLRGVYGYVLQYGYDLPLVVTSGYRTRETNQRLLSEGAAHNSMHLYGRAADIRIPGFSAELIARLGLYFSRGGVGFYAGKDFVHLDTGRRRFWRGR